MSDPQIELSIVMPCLNEAETLEICIRKALGYLERSGVVGEVIIADNGSTDGSQDIARGLGARVVDIPEKGYGAALIGGIRAARGTFVIMGDSDDSYDFSNLDPFMAKLREGYDLVMGNRFAGGIEPGAMPPLHKYLGNPVLSFVGRLLFRSNSGDFHCGLRGFRRSSALALGLQCPGMEFASELVVKATIAKQRITEVPTTLSKDGRSRPPHLRSWSDGWRHLRFLLLYSPRWVFFYPGFALIAVGLVLGGIIMAGPLRLGGVELDVNTLVVCAAAVLLGYQSVWFGVLSKAFAAREGLLPGDQRVSRIQERFPLERALPVGGLLVLVGFVGMVLAVLDWDFGSLDPRDSLRLTVPATLFLVLGVQTVLSSLLLSILGLPSSRPTAATFVPVVEEDRHPV